jgi:hypothetical protein
MKSNSTLLNAILEEMAHPRTNYDILNDIDIPEFEIQQIGVEPMPTASTMRLKQQHEPRVTMQAKKKNQKEIF